MIRTLAATHFLALALACAPASAQFRSVEVAVDNQAGRLVPLLMVAPIGKAKAVIFFSHGALSSPAKNRAIIDGWARQGFAVIAPLHADSSDWAGIKPAREQQTDWRIADMRLAKAQLAVLAAKAGMKLDRVPQVAAGHSFGGLIAMMDSDPATRAIVAFSPPGPVPGLIIPIVAKPMLTITGTADVLPMIAPKWEAHLSGHIQASGEAYACIGEGVNHYFGGVFGRPELTGPRQQAQFDTAMAQSVAFVQGYAAASGNSGKPKAKAYLLKSGCRERATR